MKKIVLAFVFLLSVGRAEELIENSNEQVKASAVSKVMERFSKLSTIESTPIEKVEEQVIEETPVLDANEVDKLEIIEAIKTAKFEDKEMPYPKSENTNSSKVTEKIVEKTPVIEKKSKESIENIEADARKIIEEEMKKVEEAKESALKKINVAMKRVEEAKNGQK